MFEVNATELRGTLLREIPIEPKVLAMLLRALESNAPDKRKSFEVALDSGIHVSVTVSPVYVEQQLEQKATTNGWVMVLHDVTHLRKAEQARAQFIAAAAHDMRSPLGVTINAVKLLESMIDLSDPTIAELIELAENGVNRLQALIDDVLRLEQIEAGYDIQSNEVDMMGLLQEANRQIRPVMANHGLNFTMELQEPLPNLHTDQQLVTRAVLNYLENAAKYTQDGGQITLKAFVKGQLLHIEVTDNGPGIPAQEQTRLFERFYRAPGTRSLPGTGLGLAIVKSVAKSNGGDVYIRSSPGHGSTFGMTLALDPHPYEKRKS